MSIIKVDPFRGIDTMVRRFNEAFEESMNGGLKFEIGDFSPRVDVCEDEKALTFHVELPGIPKDQVKVTVSNENILTISGEKKREEKSEGKNFMRVERSYGSFTRSFNLPDNLWTDKVDARFENGVLNVSIPKKEPSKPKHHEVSIH